MKLLMMLLLLSACSSSVPDDDGSPAPFQGAGHEQFFLPELPHWANGSVAGRCQRAFSVRYLDYVALEKVHGLQYPSRVELQAQFNRRWRERFVGKTTLLLTPQEEAALFLEILGQVKGGLRELRFPVGVPFQLVWWDDLQARADFKAWLSRLADEGGAVVLLSLCEGSDGLEAWANQEGLGQLGLFTLGAEVLGPQRPDGTVLAGTVMPLDSFFPVGSSTLWKGQGPFPAEFPAGYNVKTLEETHVRNGQKEIGPQGSGDKPQSAL